MTASVYGHRSLENKEPARETARPQHFPKHPTLERLLATFDPEIGYFRLAMKRRNARDLRKWLFGPQGVRDVPSGHGVRTFELPNGWMLRLTYHETSGNFREPGYVDAEFIPPGEASGALLHLRGRSRHGAGCRWN